MTIHIVRIVLLMLGWNVTSAGGGGAGSAGRSR